MITHNIRVFAYTIIGLAFATYILIFLATQDLSSIDYKDAISSISTTISINIIIWLVFIKWGWKMKIFHPWLVPFPNLSGEWSGFIKSNYEKQGTEIPTEVHISQTFFNIQVKVKTGESRSHSLGAKFDIDGERGYHQLFYSYLNTPRAGVREQSEIHYGSALMQFEGFNVKKMEGEYWTSRETTGEITLTRKKVR